MSNSTLKASLPDDQKKLIDAILEKYQSDRANIICMLHDIQKNDGFISLNSMLYLSEMLNTSANEIYGVASFYDQFRFEKQGKYVIKICEGTSCHIQGSVNVRAFLEDKLKIKMGETTSDGIFTLDHVECLGVCSLAPVMSINDKIYPELDSKKVCKIIEEIRKQEGSL